MSVLSLSHYSYKKLHNIESRSQDNLRIAHKPNGLSVSVDGDCDWKWWCERENLFVDSLKFQTRIILNQNANIKHIQNLEQLLQFGRTYRKSLINSLSFTSNFNATIDWEQVSQVYQGIIIAPYLWEARMHTECLWYHPWDCACGHIWDTTAIKSYYLINGCDKDWNKNGF